MENAYLATRAVLAGLYSDIQRFALSEISPIFRFMNKAKTDDSHALPSASQAYVNISVFSVSNITCGMVCIVNSSFRYSGSCVRI